MTRHGKNNSSRADFTHAEYRMLTHWGSQRQRLTADSMRSYNQCALCLNVAVDPTACGEGHLFCRECILTELLQQKKDAVEAKGKLERLLREQEEEREAARERARRRILDDFERTSGAIAGSVPSARRARDARSRSPEPRRGDEGPSSRARRSRSRSPPRGSAAVGVGLSSLPTRIALAAEEAERDALFRLEKEQAQARAARLPAYWLPSLTPQADAKGDEQRRFLEALDKSETRCRVAILEGHPLSIKSLIPVHFTKDSTSSSNGSGTASSGATATAAAGGGRDVCPSCRKVLTSGSTMSLLRRCGHVYCSVCVSTFFDAKTLAKSKSDSKTQSSSTTGEEDRPACLECGKRVKDLGKDVVRLQREGTGFAAGGKVVSESKKVAFQG